MATNDGGTPLYIACQEGHQLVVDSLLREGANVDMAMNDGYTPLLIACQEGHQLVVDSLLRAGANVDDYE